MPIKIKKTLKDIWFLLKNTFNEFLDDNSIKLAASLSYYTIFAIPPLLIIIIFLSGIFFGPEAVRGEIFGQINQLVGSDAAFQIQETIKNISFSTDSSFAAIISTITLLMGASGAFSEIQDSINYIWGLRAKPKRGFIKYLKNRLMSFSMIASMGFLLLVSLFINILTDLLSKRLEAYFPHLAVQIFYVVNLLLLFVIITVLFSVIFRTLPDGKVALKDALIGAAFTAFLFMVGKFAIGAYLGNTKIASTYGTAASVIIILLWVYYSAIILYFGAEFTKVYAIYFGKKIIPNKYAVQIMKSRGEVEPIEVNEDD